MPRLEIDIYDNLEGLDLTPESRDNAIRSIVDTAFDANDKIKNELGLHDRVDIYNNNNGTLLLNALYFSIFSQQGWSEEQLYQLYTSSEANVSQILRNVENIDVDKMLEYLYKLPEHEKWDGNRHEENEIYVRRYLIQLARYFDNPDPNNSADNVLGGRVFEELEIGSIDQYKISTTDEGMVKPVGMEGVDGDQIAKRRFIEELLAFTSGSNTKEIKNRLDSFRYLLLKSIDGDKPISGLQDTNSINQFWDVLTSSGDYQIEDGPKTYFDSIEDLSLKKRFLSVLKDSLERLLNNDNLYASLYGSFFPLDEGFIEGNSSAIIEEIKRSINSAPNTKEKEMLLQVKEILANVSQSWFNKLDGMIDDQKLEELIQLMRVRLNYYQNPETGEMKQRKETLILFNGHNGAGKGTYLKSVEAEAVETGTAGIMGHDYKEGYGQWTSVSGTYDFARFERKLTPNKSMTLFLVAEMLNKRQKLDEQGQFNTGVYLSGYPRTLSQANLFKSENSLHPVIRDEFDGEVNDKIEGITVVNLTITPETAVKRTISRMIEDLLNDRVRDDDISELQGFDIGELRSFLEDHAEEVSKLKDIEQEILIAKEKSNYDKVNSLYDNLFEIIDNMRDGFLRDKTILNCFELDKEEEKVDKENNRYKLNNNEITVAYRSRYKKLDSTMRGRSGVHPALKKAGYTINEVKGDGRTREEVREQIQTIVRDE